jgi:hypothetical protein
MINPWTQGHVPGARMNPTLGAWQNRRKLVSAGWVPPQWVRLSLANAHLFWYAFQPLVLTAGQTDLTRVTIQEDFWLVAILAHATSALGAGAGSFRAQIYEDQNTYKYSKYGVDQVLFTTKGTEPGLLKMPHFIANGSPVNCKIQNLDGANPNTVSMVMFGYSTWWRD